MIKALIKVASALIIFLFVLQLLGVSQLYVESYNAAYELNIYEAVLYVFIFMAVVEVLIYLGKAINRTLKNDVLISNYAFEGDKETIEMIKASSDNKIVLTRNQFDEAAILIVKAMSSITSGLMNEARYQLSELRKIIGDDAIVDILMLKIYKGEKNFDKMEHLSQKLMQNENIQLVGMKAALEAQLEKKEFTEALKTVNQAFEVRQDLYWVISSAFLLRAKNNDWLGALEVLNAGIEKNITPPQKAARLKAIALYELAKQAREEKDKTKFFKFITQSLQENSRLVPAALDLADYYLKNDRQIRKAEKVLDSIWNANPTYEVAQAYLDLFPKDTKAEKIQRMEKLALANNKRPSLNNLILAELYINAKKYAKSKTECNLFLLKNPATQRIAAILDKLEEKPKKQAKSNTSIVSTIKSHLENFGKSENIANYPKDFQWVCANCGHTSDNWQAICPQCGEIGRNYWHLYVDKDINVIEEN